MSRHAFLVRMALGRSPYEPISEDSEQYQQSPFSQDSPYQQQYNNRGQPINPRTIRETEALIAAKNEVLAAVGVCEKRDAEIDRFEDGEDGHGSRVRFSEEEWIEIRDAENDYGEWIRMVAECSRNALTWWVVALRRRLQVGIVSSNISFADILSGEWRSFTQHGFGGGLRYLVAGGLPEISAQLMLTVLDWLLGEHVFEISRKVLALKASSRKRLYILRLVSYGYKSLNVLTHLLIYPLTAFSSLQQLGLISTSTLSAPRTWLVPWHSSSPLRWALLQRPDLSPQSSGIKAILTSPACIWLVMTLVQHASAANYGHVPLCEHDCILGPHNEPPTTKEQTSFTPFSNLRDRILKALGWAAEPRLRDHGIQVLGERTHDRHTTSQSSRPRVTELSMLPSHLLALNLDNFFWSIFLLSSDTAHLRSLTSAYLASPAARANVDAGSYAGVASFGDPIAHANKVGLCFALEFSMHAVVWGGAYAWTKWVGINNFYWGRT